MTTREIEPFYAALGRRIRRARESQGLSQAELGSSLAHPMTRASIANIENAKQRTLVHTVVEFAGTLGVPVSELIPTQASATHHSEPTVEVRLSEKLGIPSAIAHQLFEDAK